MKKYLRIIIVALLVAGIASGCKKDSTPKPTCRIITASGASGQANFTYNSEGKLISVSEGSMTTSLAYSGNTIITHSKNAGVFYEKKIITLNSNGLASNARIESDMAGTNWQNYFYEYNGSEVIKQTLTNSMGSTPEVTTLTWSGGNVIAISAAGYTQALEYYTDKSARAGDYLQLSQLSGGYQILRNKNIVKSVLQGASILNFDYTYDADGKITSVIISGSASDTYTYQYQCN